MYTTVHPSLVYFRIRQPIPGIPRRPICLLPIFKYKRPRPSHTHVLEIPKDIFAAPEVVALQLKRQPAVASPSIDVDSKKDAISERACVQWNVCININ